MINNNELLIKYNITFENILSELCWYDIRNPDNVLDYMDQEFNEYKNKECACDNCFYGRTKLANLILELL